VALQTASRRRLPAGTIPAEPFRILFPLGMLIGVSGVSLWPLYFSGLHKFYPGIMHARLMIEGFMGAFIFGFLGTAMPRLTGTKPLSRIELTSMIVLLLVATGLHIGHQHGSGDAVFLLLLLFFAAQMGRRFLQRTDQLPPTFVLVALGFANAIAGAALLVGGAMGVQDLRWPALGLLLLYQGFILYLVLGVGGFLLPRFLGLPARSEMPDGAEASTAWKRRALFAAATGFVLLASFVLEVFAAIPKGAGTLRFLAAAVFLAAEIPFHRSSGGGVTIIRSLRLGLILLLLGLLFPVLWPMQRVAGLHLVFIGGFTLITLTVATRVVLGHSGLAHLTTAPLPFLRMAAVLLFIAAFLRVAGDFQWALRGRLLDFASYSWMLAAGIWSWRVLPKVRLPDLEETAA